jgi:chromosome segregation ATPase
VNDENTSIAQLQQHLEMFKADNEQLSKLAKSMQEEKDHIQLEARKMQADIVLLTSRLEAAQAAEREALALKAKLSSETDALKVKLSEIAAAKGDTDGKSEQPTELQEQISDLLSQRELMIEELAQRKAMLEATVKEMELTMCGAEQAVLTKGEEIKGLVLLFPIFVCSYVCVSRRFQDEYYLD